LKPTIIIGAVKHIIIIIIVVKKRYGGVVVREEKINLDVKLGNISKKKMTMMIFC